MLKLNTTAKVRSLATAVTFASALLIAPAFAVQAPDSKAAAAATDPSVLAFDQKAEGNKVKLTYAFLPQDGYVVIYAGDDKDKASGDPLGSAALKAGDHRDVMITLKTAPTAKTKLWATLYRDTDGDGKHKSGTDVSLWGEKLPLENQFMIQ